MLMRHKKRFPYCFLCYSSIQDSRSMRNKLKIPSKCNNRKKDLVDYVSTVISESMNFQLHKVAGVCNKTCF